MHERFYNSAHVYPINLSTSQINVEGAVTIVKHIADSHDASGLNTGRQEVLYGTHNGVLGQLFLDQQTAKQGWQMRSDVHKGIALFANRWHNTLQVLQLHCNAPGGSCTFHLYYGLDINQSICAKRCILYS